MIQSKVESNKTVLVKQSTSAADVLHLDKQNQLESKINELNNESKKMTHENITESCNNENVKRQSGSRSQPAKYFTISSSAGQKFKQILKRYV